MATRIETPFTNEHFKEFCLSMVGQPYWYGTTGNRATESLLKRKTAQYPTHYPASRTARYKKDIRNKKIVCDCIGGCKAYAWTGGGETLLKALETGESYALKSGSNGCPDKNANGMFSYAKSRGMPNGDMKTLPDLPGIALWKDGHVGYTVGDGYLVEWRSFAYGCVKTKISQRNFKNWYYLPFIDYGNEQNIIRGLKKGMTGADVREMQKKLMEAGYALPKYGADGDFGGETEEALKQFQLANGINPDGVLDDTTRKLLFKEEGKLEMPGKKVIIKANGGNVNLRLGNGTEYEKVALAKNGERFPYIATAENGWYAVKDENTVLWVSGKYSVLQEN